MKIIRRMRKGIAALLIMGTVGMGLYMTADACNKSSGCYAENHIVECSKVQELVRGAHYVEEPNGYGSWCYVSEVLGEHTIKCSGCKVELRKENRTCAQLHTNEHCYDQYYLCQY